MFWLDASLKRYYLGRAFDYNGKQYPASSATAAIFTSLGFTGVTLQARPDDRYYVVTGPNNDGSWNSTARPLGDLQIQQKRQQFRERVLANTASFDIAIQAFQDSVAVPTNWATFRSDVIATQNANIALIDAVADVPALIDLIEAPKWVLRDPNQPALGYEENADDHFDTYPIDPDDLSYMTGEITFTRNGGLGHDLESAVWTQEVEGGMPLMEYELTLRIEHTNDILYYTPPLGYSDTGCFSSGDQTVTLLLRNQLVKQFVLADVATPQVFTL